MGQQELNTICSLLPEKYGERGSLAAQRLQTWASGAIPFAYPEWILQHRTPDLLPLVFDAFWQVLPFGTGGRRGPVGYGPNRLNHATIVLTVQGHCNYLRSLVGAGPLSVVVANDVRVFRDLRNNYGFLGTEHPLLGLSSRKLAKLACEVYTSNGIVCYLAEPESDSAVLTTPELSFLISSLGAAGGVNISASHNPPDDNGIKVYDQFGSQPVAPDDQLLIDTMALVGEVHPLPFAEGLARNLILDIPGDQRRKYIDAYATLFSPIKRSPVRHPLVFTPLCGCGLTTVGRVLPELGFEVRTPPAEGPDGSFAAIPFRIANPEVPEATDPARRFADELGLDVVFSSDPDADRIGVEARLADGTWYHFDGNQIAAMLCYFLMLDPKGPQRKGLVIETLVTTRILRRIAERAGGWAIDDLLVGFKYVASVLKEIEQKGQTKGRPCKIADFVMAAEESHGVVVLPSIRDKDATGGCMYLGALYERLKSEGQTLLDYYTHILDEVGECAEVSRSLVMVGAEGVFRRDQMMESLRQNPPTAIAGNPVLSITDYLDETTHGSFASESDKLPRNVIHYVMETFTLTVRPSGTEPKLKLYSQRLPGKTPPKVTGRERMEWARQSASVVVEAAYEEVLRRIGLNVGPISLLLPDIIDVGRKESFENTVIPELIREVNTGRFTACTDMLAWLRSRSGDLLPGADAVPALKATLAFLNSQAFMDGPTALRAEIEAWTRP